MAAQLPRTLGLRPADLAMVATSGGAPAIDREFRAIDFLTWVDVQSPAVVAKQAGGRFVV